MAYFLKHFYQTVNSVKTKLHLSNLLMKLTLEVNR